ncbi:DNA cytosine methyltransferase [Streptomyces sp. NPDC001404]|uniref:DNA cytosine methyltransferase n=1 Tax=Streptomyces sp. NPDC001404 TaxID=3364571 RepID=UPI003674545F
MRAPSASSRQSRSGSRAIPTPFANTLQRSLDRRIAPACHICRGKWRQAASMTETICSTTAAERASSLTSIEVCAGAGGLALGLEQAGFRHSVLLELDSDACRTMRRNRPRWPVLQADLRSFRPRLAVSDRRVDLLSGGVPCPPFSVAGKQLGQADERDLFPSMLRLVEVTAPRAVLIENVKGLAQARFVDYRQQIRKHLESLGYSASWKVLYACDYGVPQLRPRAVLVALHPADFDRFTWPAPLTCRATAPTVGQVLYESMTTRDWELAEAWAEAASTIAPTLCGGSRKHGGPDLGPSRARETWSKLGVNGSGVADQVPGPGTALPVKLTVAQTALLQGFPPGWQFSGGKTSAYRQVGNAFPPPFAAAVGRSLAAALLRTASPEASENRRPTAFPAPQPKPTTVGWATAMT